MENAPVTPTPPPTASSAEMRAAQDGLRRLERIDWSLWATAIAVMLLLAVAAHSYTMMPGVMVAASLSWIACGLIGAVILFAVFAIHKHVLINRVRRQLAAQMNLAAALQTRAEAFQKLAILDPLTGLYNRRFVMQQLPLELARAERCRYRVTALMLDLNRLKEINDKYSHLAGDLALREFAGGLRRAIRSSDVAVRIGGDEFLVVLPDCDASEAAGVLARLSELQFSYHGQVIPITYAAGWAEYEPGEAPEVLLARADQRLYEDKQTGSAGHRVRAAHEDLREAEKMELMGRFTGSVAHEFNNLLTIIKGYAELLLQEPTAQNLLGPLKHIHRSAERATKLTGQLLAFSRRQALDPKQLSVPAVISGMDALLQRLLGDGIQLTLQISSEVREIRADRGQIEQIIMHLLVNARAATQREGKVMVEVSDWAMDEDFVAGHPGARAGSYVRIAVRDSGPCMDEATRIRLFEPPSHLTPRHRGSGMGLATVYGVLKQIGGYIWVDTGDEGNCVTVYLPSAVDGVTMQARRNLPVAAVPCPRGTGTVLVVENFDGLRAFMRDFLLSAGYKVLEASNGEQAMSLVADAEQRVDVVICDVILPGMSGLELGECLTVQERKIQLLYVAGYAEDAMLYRECLRSAHFLAAPFTTEEFQRKLNEMAVEAHAGPGESCQASVGN